MQEGMTNPIRSHSRVRNPFTQSPLVAEPKHLHMHVDKVALPNIEPLQLVLLNNLNDA